MKTWRYVYSERSDACGVSLCPEGLRIRDAEKNLVEIPMEEIPELVKGIVGLVAMRASMCQPELKVHKG